MAKKEKELIVEDMDKQELEDVKWDMLAVLYKDVSTNIANAMSIVTTTGKTFVKIIEEDKTLNGLYKSTVTTLTELGTELNKSLESHCKVTVVNGKKEYRPYVGVVDKADENQIALYLALVMAYSNISDKVTTVFETIQTTLLGEISAYVEKNNLTDKKVELDKLTGKE